MTREEAIKNIKEHCYFANLIPQAKEALDMAIKALEQEPRKITYEDVKGYCKPRCLTIIDNELLYELTHPKIKALEQEPCDKYIKEIDHLRKYISKLETQIIEQEPSGDLISREPFTDSTICEGFSCDECSFNQKDRGGCILEERVMNLPSVEQKPKTGHWISVSERLPEDEVEVLIYTTDNKINKAYRRHKSWTENQKEWLVFETLGYGYIYDDDEVLAWMPLPKPYKPQESEDNV